MTDVYIEGRKFSLQDDGRLVHYYPTKAERLVVNFTPQPDPRDARIAELERILAHIRTIASESYSQAVGLEFVLESIAVLAIDALAGAEPEPVATTFEELAI